PVVGHLDEASFVLGGFVLARGFADLDETLRRSDAAPLLFRLLGYRGWWLVNIARGRHRSGARGIVAVGGAARSGTTLLRTALGRHPHIVSGPEATVFLRRITAPRHLGPRLGLDPARIERWQFQSRSQVEFIERFHRAMLRSAHRPVWVEKTPANVFRFSFARRAFPHAQLVHIVRDGRDAVCSLRQQPWAKIPRAVPRDSAEAARLCGTMWAASVRAGLRHRGDPRYHELRYEDLVARPEPTLRALLDFLEIRWDPCVLAGDPLRAAAPLPGAYSDDREDDVHRSLHLDAIAAGRDISGDSLGRWRTELSRDDLAALGPVMTGLLVRLGYEADGRWALPPAERTAAAAERPSASLLKAPFAG
ncbi:MAG: sulfotransferase, partial [Proteobacteria bacterium]|nr:sulfotransferase [Pseudomonadota bacterium]